MYESLLRVGTNNTQRRRLAAGLGSVLRPPGHRPS